MKLLELEITGYGAIDRRTLDFSQQPQALHLIYGPNEAGKSTTLRAILALLYGVEHHSADAKLYGSEALKLRGRLESAGAELIIGRRKGSKNTLLDADNNVLDENVLRKALGGLPQAVFASLFGLDHERLRSGGEQLRLGRGDLGESLFQAGLGAPGIHNVLTALHGEAEALFRPRGKAPLNLALQEYQKAKRDVRDRATRTEQVRAQQDELERMRARANELLTKRNGLLAEQSRLQRTLRVLPPLARRRDLLERSERLGAVVTLPKDAAEQRLHAQTTLQAAELQSAQLARQLETLEQRRAALVIPASLIEVSKDAMRSVRDRLGNHVKAGGDLPRRRIEHRARVDDAEQALRALGNPVPYAEVESLRLDRAAQARITKLASEHSGLVEKLRAAERELEAADDALEQVRVELAVFPQAAGKGERPAIDSLVLPAVTQVDAALQRWEKHERLDEELTEGERDLRARNDALLIALGTLEREGVPPTEADLGGARAERDAALQEALADTGASAGRKRAVAGAALERVLPAVKRADELADRLRREASRVAQHARLLAERDALERERTRLLDHRAELAQLREQWQQQWRGLFEPLAIEPGEPKRMLAVVQKLSADLERARRGRSAAGARKASAQQAIASWQAEWSGLMQRLRLHANASVEEAHAVQDALRTLFERVEATRALQARIDGMERDAREFERDVHALIERHAPELAALPLADAADALLARYDKAQRDRELAEQLDADIAQARAASAAAKAQSTHERTRLQALMSAASALDLRALEHAESRSAEARELAQRLQEVGEELLGLSEGTDLQTLLTECAEETPDAIRARLAALDEDLAALAEEHGNASRQIGSLENGLLHIERNAYAADAALDAEELLSRIKDQAASYARARLAEELLQREIRRYRDRNKGPLVSHAAELFARLTLGRYPRLEVGFDERDEPVLQCVDDNNRSCAVETLSDGTRDQLYLALRLASIRLFCERNESLPLVLDDVLIHFDDPRAEAAFALLGELSQVTQILFFTHHEHHVRLARAAVPEGRLVEHRLMTESAKPAQLGLPLLATDS